jgi:uncharacterized membrane protein
MHEEDRTGALRNGALIGIGALAIVDNIVAHWLLGLHRAIPGPWAGPVEVGLVVLGAGMLAVGLWRERRARRR